MLQLAAQRLDAHNLADVDFVYLEAAQCSKLRYVDGALKIVFAGKVGQLQKRRFLHKVMDKLEVGEDAGLGVDGLDHLKRLRLEVTRASSDFSVRDQGEGVV